MKPHYSGYIQRANMLKRESQNRQTALSLPKIMNYKWNISLQLQGQCQILIDTVHLSAPAFLTWKIISAPFKQATGDYKTSRIWRLGGWSSFRCASQADLVSLLRRWKTRQSRRKALMSAQLLGKAFQTKTARDSSVSATCQSNMDGMSSDSRKVDSKVLNQVRLRGKEQVFRSIHVVPYRERKAWSQLQKRKSASKQCHRRGLYVKLTVAVKRIHIRDIQERHRHVDDYPCEHESVTIRSVV